MRLTAATTIGLVWLAVGGCAHKSVVPVDSAVPPSDGNPWWSPILLLGSIEGIPEALLSPFDSPIDVTRTAQTGKVEQSAMTNCETYFALREKGYEATTETDFAAMKMAGTRCQTLRLLRHTTSQRHGPLVGFVFDHDSLAALPPALGPQPSPGETARRENGTKQGLPWSAVDPQATFTARSPEIGVVRGPDWTTKLEIMARGAFTGDGSDDVLVRTLSYGTTGSWSEIRLRVLSHDANQPVLVIRKELPL